MKNPRKTLAEPSQKNYIPTVHSIEQVIMMATYYDFILGFIPLALLGLGGGLHIAGLTLTTAITVGGLVAVALVGHALFVNGPVDARPAEPTPTHETVDATQGPVSMSD
jgi:hypothetical protein